MVSLLACRKDSKPIANVRIAVDMAGAKVIFVATIARTAVATTATTTSVVEAATPTI